jgi:hypothetical protein
LVCQIDRANREHMHNAIANTVGRTISRVIPLWVIADTRFDLPHALDDAIFC